jgi:nucleoside-diphosphate-sugar epimerase
MTPFVVFNGAGGGLGRHLGAALAGRGIQGAALHARLGDRETLLEELDDLPIEAGAPLALIQNAAVVPIDTTGADPGGAYEVNVTQTGETAGAFIEWAGDHGHVPGVVFVSSGHVYAPPVPGKRVAENAPVRPMSVYARTKLAGEERLRTLLDDHAGKFVAARVFGMIGPDQRPSYLLPGLIRRARSGDLGGVPGLDYVRDYLDARDVARHLASLAGSIDTAVETVNVCSGEPSRIGELLDRILQIEHAGDERALAAARERVTAAPGRDSDVTWLVGDPSLLAERVGEPIRSVDLSDTIAEAMG